MVSAYGKHAVSRPGTFAILLTSTLVVGAGALDAQQAEIPVGALPSDYDAAIAQNGIDGSYGYFRTIDGSVTVIQTGTGERVRVEVNEPILVGDRIFVAGGSRAELVLADRNIVRVGEKAELGFRALASSGDSNDPTSVVELRRGTIQLVVVEGQLGQDFPSVVTPNASVRVRSFGSFLIVVDDDTRSEVVVREGRTEVITEAEAAEVRAGESLFVEGSRGENLEFAAAPSLDRLEAWGRDLSEYGGGEYAEYVDSDLQYSAASLRGHGSWVTVGGGSAWRPYVAAGWAPYRDGRWRYTPSGLFWVSYEPWGWVPYHYGYWDLHSSYGWIWYPGRRFASAHVYWYWGDQYAGWVPSGYYWNYYGNRYGSRFGFYFGVYGNVGGGFGAYRHWTFLPHGRLGHRRQNFYSVNGHDLERRRSSLGRGVLFTDTRSLRPDTWRRPGEALAGLRRIGSRDGRTLPDARAFVQRSPRLPQALERLTLTGRDARSIGGTRSAGGSVRPGRSTVDARRPNVNRRQVEGRSRRLEDRTLRSGATSRDGSTRGRNGRVQSNPTRGRTGSSTLRRPTTGSREPSGVRRPERRPRLDAGAADARPTTRPTVNRQSRRPTLRRPEQPVTRSGSRSRPAARPATPVTRSTPSRPSVRPQARSAPSRRSATRPQARSGSSRPSVQRSPSRSSRPTVRRSGGGSSRPTVRRSGGGTSRPTVRRSGGSSSRPRARSSSSGSSSRPTVRRSGGGSSRPAARRNSPSSSRPTVRRSAGSRSSRPSVSRGSSSRPSRPSVSRSSGSRATPRASSGSRRGSTRSSGSSRGRGRRGG